MGKVKFENFWCSHQDEFLRLLAIPSVYDEATADRAHPYGLPVYHALLFMKEKFEELGLEIREYDNTSLSGSFGKGERIDLVSHLDVVAPGDGWEYGPFNPTVKDGAIIARGAQDMKSGAWLTYLAVKMLMEEGCSFSKEIRIVLGTDEERTMDDMRNYVKKAGLPAFAFTPDGHFPMVIGEKGACMWTMEKNYTGSVISMEAGVQPNVVSPLASAIVRNMDREEIQTLIDSEGMNAHVTEENGLCRIHVTGAPAHASRPHLGHSATTDLLRILSLLTKEEDMKELYKLSAGIYGEGAGLSCDIPPMGRLTLNPGVITIKEGRIYAMVDCRYPYGITSEQLNAVFTDAFSSYTIKLPYDDPATLVKEDDPYIRALKNGYEKALGQPCKTEISGGVSYSKVFGHCVNFGPVGLNSAGMAHQRDESILIRDCINALAVYYESLKELMEV